jgi:hypothetical protein
VKKLVVIVFAHSLTVFNGKGRIQLDADVHIVDSVDGNLADWIYKIQRIYPDSTIENVQITDCIEDS